jgi:hypothetical protein
MDATHAAAERVTEGLYTPTPAAATLSAVLDKFDDTLRAIYNAVDAVRCC